jgi:hypothetical protein
MDIVKHTIILQCYLGALDECQVGYAFARIFYILMEIEFVDEL